MNKETFQKKIVFMPLLFLVLSVIPFWVRNGFYVAEGDWEGFFLCVEEIWKGILIAIVLSVLLVFVNKAKAKKNYGGLVLAIANLLFLLIMLLGLFGGYKATSSTELVNKGALWRFVYGMNPCYELLVKLAYGSRMIEVSLIIQTILVIVSVVSGLVLSLRLFLKKAE